MKRLVHLSSFLMLLLFLSSVASAQTESSDSGIKAVGSTCDPAPVETLKAMAWAAAEEMSFQGARILQVGPSAACAFVIGVAPAPMLRPSMRRNATRSAQVKARREVVLLFEGSTIESETIILSEQTVTEDEAQMSESYMDKIRETSSGFIDSMLPLDSRVQDEELVVVLYKQL